MMRPPDAAADPIGSDEHDAPGDRNQAKPDRDRQPDARQVCTLKLIRKIRSYPGRESRPPVNHHLFRRGNPSDDH